MAQSNNNTTYTQRIQTQNGVEVRQINMSDTPTTKFKPKQESDLVVQNAKTLLYTLGVNVSDVATDFSGRVFVEKVSETEGLWCLDLSYSLNNETHSQFDQRETQDGVNIQININFDTADSANTYVTTYLQPGACDNVKLMNCFSDVWRISSRLPHHGDKILPPDQHAFLTNLVSTPFSQLLRQLYNIDNGIPNVDPRNPKLYKRENINKLFCENLTRLATEYLNKKKEDVEEDVDEVIVGRKVKPKTQTTPTPSTSRDIRGTYTQHIHTKDGVETREINMTNPLTTSVKLEQASPAVENTVKTLLTYLGVQLNNDAVDFHGRVYTDKLSETKGVWSLDLSYRLLSLTEDNKSVLGVNIQLTIRFDTTSTENTSINYCCVPIDDRTSATNLTNSFSDVWSLSKSLPNDGTKLSEDQHMFLSNLVSDQSSELWKQLLDIDNKVEPKDICQKPSLVTLDTSTCLIC